MLQLGKTNLNPILLLRTSGPVLKAAPYYSRIMAYRIPVSLGALGPRRPQRLQGVNGADIYLSNGYKITRKYEGANPLECIRSEPEIDWGRCLDYKRRCRETTMLFDGWGRGCGGQLRV